MSDRKKVFTGRYETLDLAVLCFSIPYHAVRRLYNHCSVVHAVRVHLCALQFSINLDKNDAKDCEVEEKD